ncbi:sorting nexin-2-like isoform X2 [Varroa destructor]|uniref:PX domain-containing protein n=1 Tax=Varroa destructor TaxID=109461 RepID=A0A7M7KSA8_VARDE|nr:sorting nexin-2-like isoform X2 [Varroa destructor]
MSNPLQQDLSASRKPYDSYEDDDLFVSTVESLGGVGGGGGKGEGDNRKITAGQQELNHNILEAAEDIDLNDDDPADVTRRQTGLDNDEAAKQTSVEDHRHLSPLEQVPPAPTDPDSSGPPAMLHASNTATNTNNNDNSHSIHKQQTQQFLNTISANGQPDDRFIDLKVSQPTKVGDGMSAYLVYKIITKTNLGFFKKGDFTVSRRFSDFLGLYEKLVEKHLAAGRIVPPAPEKNVVGMTKVKMGKEEVATDEFVERRRCQLERFLRRVSRHPVLVADPDFREFLELEGDLPKSTHTSALSGAGVIKLISRVGDTVNKITYKMDENDSSIQRPEFHLQWFEDKTVFIDNLDIQLRKLHTSLDFMVTQRRELAANSGIFARSAAMLGNCEEHTGLSRCLSKLSELHEKVEQTQSQQANHDFFLLAELLKDYIGLVGAIKDAFHQRVKVYQTWQHAQQTLTKKREQLNRYQLAARSDRIPTARNEVEEWEAKVERGEEEFRQISKVIKHEVEGFEVKRIEEFKNSIIRYMECLLETQQQLAQLWETFLPEARAIEE